MTKMKYVKLSHIIANQDPQLCTDEVEKFCKNKIAAIVTYSTTAIPTGGNQVGRAMQFTFMFMTSAIIHWETTEAEAQRWQQELRAKSGIIKTS